MEKSCYRVNLPYPDICIEHKNKFYASLLLNDYASANSELTAITQYVYAHAKEADECVSKIFLGIAVVEMTHLDLLADMILELGVNPKFYDGCLDFWRGDFVPYGKTSRDRLKLAIKGEYAAIVQYEKHIQQINDCNIQCVLERIILDEKLHVNIFKQLLCEIYGN